jgi:hypothetical protein
VILVVSTADDPHAAAVLAVLRARGTPSVLLDAADALEQPLSATVGLAPLRAGVGDVALDDVETVWLRRFTAPRTALEGAPGVFAQREATSLLLSLAAALRDRRWANPLSSALATDGGYGKLSQLEAARRVGLEVPETLATNQPGEARAFVAEHQDVVYKPFESPHLADKRVIFCRRVAPDDPLEQVLLAPCIFQRRVEKRCDVRGLVLGDRVLAAEIHSQAHPDSATDFRRAYRLGETHYAEHVLPPDVAARLVALHRALGLAMGAFDLVQRPDGGYVFLETNQQGQYLWLQDQVPSLRLTEAVADLLTSPEAWAGHRCR